MGQEKKDLPESTEQFQEWLVQIAQEINGITAIDQAIRQGINERLFIILEAHTRRRKIIQLVQDLIGQLRLDMKYLIFDLEATRMERDLYYSYLIETGWEEEEHSEQDDDSEDWKSDSGECDEDFNEKPESGNG